MSVYYCLFYQWIKLRAWFSLSVCVRVCVCVCLCVSVCVCVCLLSVFLSLAVWFGAEVLCSIFSRTQRGLFVLSTNTMNPHA